MSSTRNTTTPTNASLPTCRCGHDRRHHLARPSMRYGWGGWLMLFSGGSATPVEVTVTCARCGEVIEHSRDPEVRREYRGW